MSEWCVVSPLFAALARGEASGPILNAPISHPCDYVIVSVGESVCNCN